MIVDLEKLAQKGRVLKIAKMGHPILSKRSEEIDPQSDEAKQIIADMAATLEDFGAVAGLAAPQVYINKRIIFYNVDPDRGDEHSPEGHPPTFLINPKYSALDETTVLGWEGCLSVPDLVGEVPRFTSIRLQALDMDGKAIDEKIYGYHARVLQHEIDHLDGILYPQRMQDMSRLAYMDEAMRYLRELD